MTAREIIEEARIYAGDPRGRFHDEDRALFALNRALRRISSRSRSIHDQSHHSVVAEQYQYALPPGALYIRKARYKSGTWCDMTRGHFTAVDARAAYPGGGIPRSFSMWQNARFEKVTTTVAYVYEVGDELRVGYDAVGGGVLKGDLVINLSDKLSVGHVTEVYGQQGGESGTTSLIAYSKLEGGTRETFTNTDELRIVSPETSGHSILIAPSPVTSDEEGEESLAIFVARRHRTITSQDMDNGNDGLELDEELQDCLMYEFLHWLWVQREGLDTTAQLYRRLSNTEYKEVIGKVENRIAQNLNMWETRLGGGYRREVQVKESANFNDYRIG